MLHLEVKLLPISSGITSIYDLSGLIAHSLRSSGSGNTRLHGVPERGMLSVQYGIPPVLFPYPKWSLLGGRRVTRDHTATCLTRSLLHFGTTDLSYICLHDSRNLFVFDKKANVFPALPLGRCRGQEPCVRRPAKSTP